MTFDLGDMEPAGRYRLLMSTVVPRPIAWISTVDTVGIVNLAPFSCFNVMGASPPMIAVGMQPRSDGRLKDSCTNIEQTGELVVNLVSRGEAEAMFLTAQDHAPEVDETLIAGLRTRASKHVRPPRVAASPCSLECRSYQIVKPGPDLTIVLAEVLAVHLRDELVPDPALPRIDTEGLELIGRMEGPGWYTACGERFRIPKFGAM